MARKKWTPQTEVTDSLLRFREKRKWQLSYRRYVLEKMPCESYARYFGLDIETLRAWFEQQFTGDQSWDNFGKAWQFYHIVPTHYFDFSLEQDMLLCWNFINIGIESLAENNTAPKLDPLAVRLYFQEMHTKTSYPVCQQMLGKVDLIEKKNIPFLSANHRFVIARKADLENILTLTEEEFNRLNQGNTIADLLLEREILKKFG